MLIAKAIIYQPFEKASGGGINFSLLRYWLQKHEGIEYEIQRRFKSSL